MLEIINGNKDAEKNIKILIQTFHHLFLLYRKTTPH